MEKRKRKVRPQLKDLIPDEERRNEIVSRLYKGDPIVGEDGGSLQKKALEILKGLQG